EFLDAHAIAKAPKEVRAFVQEMLLRAGRVRLVKRGDDLVLDVDADYRDDVLAAPGLDRHVDVRADGTIVVGAGARGEIKQTLLKATFPVDDRAGYLAGDRLPVALRPMTLGGERFVVRDYQRAAAQNFYQDGSERGGSGVVVLPCGAGKT